MKTIFAILLMCFTGFAFAQDAKEDGDVGQDPGAMGEEEGDESEKEGTFLHTSEDYKIIFDLSDEESEEGEEQPE